MATVATHTTRIIAIHTITRMDADIRTTDMVITLASTASEVSDSSTTSVSVGAASETGTTSVSVDAALIGASAGVASADVASADAALVVEASADVVAVLADAVAEALPDAVAAASAAADMAAASVAADTAVVDIAEPLPILLSRPSGPFGPEGLPLG
jgi:hypothetical protein